MRLPNPPLRTGSLSLPPLKGIIVSQTKGVGMDRDEAGAILMAHLESFRGRPHAELLRLMGDVHVAEVSGPSGAEYQIEVEVVWESPRQRSDIRVLGAIDDGRIPGSIAPVTHDFIVALNDLSNREHPLQVSVDIVDTRPSGTKPR